MHFKRIVLILPLLIVVFVLLNVHMASAAKLTGSDNRIETIQEQMAQNHASLNEANAEYENSCLEAQALDSKLHASEVKLAAIQNKLETLKKDLSNYKIFGFTIPSAHHLSALVLSRDINDFIIKLSALAITMDRDNKEAQQLAQAKKRSTLEKEGLIARKCGEVKKIAIARQRRDELKGQVDSQHAKLASYAQSGSYNHVAIKATKQPSFDKKYAMVELNKALSQSFTSRGETRSGFVFPVAGPHHYTDTFGEPRSGGRRHKGCDVMSSRGTPVVACVSGTIKQAIPYAHGIGGITIWIVGDDGNTYYFAHLNQILPGVVEGVRVVAGQVIAYVGSTGNAPESAPHLHFEIHPGGGGATDPYMTLRSADK